LKGRLTARLRVLEDTSLVAAGCMRYRCIGFSSWKEVVSRLVTDRRSSSLETVRRLVQIFKDASFGRLKGSPDPF
jgi:hypothetical protein